MRAPIVLSVATLVAVLSAGAPAGELRPAIIGGGPSSADRDGAVLLVHENARGDWVFLCTAALVAPNLVVTARHCVSSIADPNVACDAEGRQVAGGTVGADRAPERFKVFVGRSRPERTAAPAALGRSIHHDGATTLCGHDIAFLVLDRDVEDAPIFPVRLSGPTREGEALVAVGYGVTSDEDEPALRQERHVTVRHVGPFEGAIDAPPVAPRDFLIGESFCLGDSGGPALSAASGALVGIATRVANGHPAPETLAAGCAVGPASPQVFAFYTQVGAFGELARAAFAAAGRAPWIEGQRDPRLPPEDDGCAIGRAQRAPDRALVPLGVLLLTAALSLSRRGSRRS